MWVKREEHKKRVTTRERRLSTVRTDSVTRYRTGFSRTRPDGKVSETRHRRATRSFAMHKGKLKQGRRGGGERLADSLQKTLPKSTYCCITCLFVVRTTQAISRCPSRLENVCGISLDGGYSIRAFRLKC